MSAHGCQNLAHCHVVATQDGNKELSRPGAKMDPNSKGGECPLPFDCQSSGTCQFWQMEGIQKQNLQ